MIQNFEPIEQAMPVSIDSYTTILILIAIVMGIIAIKKFKNEK